ncbi:MAG: radical SAM family heme chaperone HemW [Betaproteobacteria bacterium]
MTDADSDRSENVVATVPLDAMSRPRFTALPPLALYVHLPWCVRKCPYCDFNSHQAPDELPESAYVDALVDDLERALPAIWGRKVVTVFIGGGTPSLFSDAAIDRLLSAIRARVPLLPDAEVTLEANPGTFERNRFAGYFAAGVNRLSIGIQSFDDRHLHALGRVHDGDEARRAAESAVMIFGNVNLDLMFALPSQTANAAARDVAVALQFAPAHLSLYHLTLEPNTHFHRYPPTLPDDDTAADIEDAVRGAADAAGYVHYETSAHALPGRECRHNVNYWRFGDYLGIGAGAHSKLSFPDRVVRQVRWKHPQRYLDAAADGIFLQDEAAIDRHDLPFEFMLNALRLSAGVPASMYAERTGMPLASVSSLVQQAVARGLLEDDPLVLKPTPLGRRFQNDLQAIFLPTADRASARRSVADRVPAVIPIAVHR